MDLHSRVTLWRLGVSVSACVAVKDSTLKSIVPLSSVARELVIDYLAAKGFSEAVTRWKYFDEAFARGRERGMVWVNRGRVRGFIGIIPVTRATPAGDRPMVWTCDWSLEDPARSPGIGVKLLQRVQSDYVFVGGVGGSSDTHDIVPAMNTRTVEGAAVFLHRPLRLAALLEKTEQRLPFLSGLSRTPLGRIPLRRRAGPDRVLVVPGVAPAMGTLFDQPAQDHCRVRYTQEHLEWYLGRCPYVRAVSCLLGDPAAPEAGALLWHHVDDPAHWRVAYRTLPGGDPGPVIAAVADHAAAAGGTVVSSIVSSLDTELVSIMKASGHLEGSKRWPLYIPQGVGPEWCQQGFSQMSYLDTDLANSF